MLFNGSLSLFKSIYQLLNSSSTDPPPFLAWLTGHLRFYHLSKFSSFYWVCCHHYKVGDASTLVSWFGYTLKSDSDNMSSSPNQVLTYFPHVLQFFCNLHLVVFAPLFILSVPSPNRAFKKLLNFLPCYIQYFLMDFYQVILYIHPMQIHHQLLLLHPLLLLNGVFNISPPMNIVGSFMYL